MNESVSRLPRLAVPTGGAARYLLEAAVFLPLYLVLDWASYIEPLGRFNITPWNPGPALAIVWMMRSGLARAPVVLAAVLLADLLVRDPPASLGVSLLGALALAGGYAALAAALRALLPPGRPLGTIRALSTMVGVVAAGTALIGAAFLGVLFAAGLLPPDVLAFGWLRFWIGDVVGILMTAPLLLVAADAEQRAGLAALLRRPESYLQAGLIVFSLWLILAGLGGDPAHHFFLLFPPLIWVALRGGLASALLAVTTVQLGVVLAFHQAHSLPILHLQALVATLTLTGLYLGVMVDERQRTMERLQQSLHFAAAGEMAGAITHEVSQPLTALASYSRSAKLLVNAAQANPELASLIDKILAESLRASRVVRRLREFFRTGAMRLQPLAPAELLELVRGLGAEVTGGTGVAFAVDAAPDLPRIHADRLQLELALRNLLANALDSVQAHAPGRGRISVSVQRSGNRRLRIAVLDNGPGVPPAARERIFRPFASGKPNGTGLGLSVSRAIAEAHGGSLDVASAEHGEFHLTLSLEPGIG